MTQLSINIAPDAVAQRHIRDVFQHSVDRYTRDLDSLHTARMACSHLPADAYRVACDAFDLLEGQIESSVLELQAGIDEIDRVAAINAAIRAAGY